MQIVTDVTDSRCYRVLFLDRSENFLLLHDVLHQVGMKRDKFLSAYAGEVVVHEIGQKMSDRPLSRADDEDSATAAKKSAAAAAGGGATRVEFVRMSDVIRRLLSIDMSLVSTIDRDAVTDASWL